MFSNSDYSFDDIKLALLLEQIFKNTYATILIGLFLYILPDVFHRIGFTFKVLYPLKFVNITSVLSGDLAKDYDLTSIDRKSTRLNSSHVAISYAVFCLKKKKNK